MNKWDKWYANQNEATRVWLDAQAKEDNKLICLGMSVGFVFGLMLGIVILQLLYSDRPNHQGGHCVSFHYSV